ncbi:MAG: endolytic transglycosylase MltG [Bacteroidales bacterium]|nr:endolytic transglycosylase MltG [Bacteroidales bacterium]
MTKRKKRTILALIGFFITGGIAFLGGYQVMLAPNVQKDGFLYIPTGSTYQQVKDSLIKNDFLRNPRFFDIWQRQKSYQNLVRPGRYELRKGMNNRELVTILRSGKQTPTRLTFNNIRTLDQFASRVSDVLEMDSASLMDAILDPDFLERNGLTRYNVKAIFIPNTYDMWWNIAPSQFVERMRTEHERFWNEDRRRRATARNLTPIEVAILASIIQAETNRVSEMPTMASVYLNRLRRGMLLQADPTVKFAVGDFTLRRILHAHLRYESPFNTYIHRGLPPGPVNFPSPTSLDAVLNSPSTNYLFFCARADFSGYHVFATTHAEHVRNARLYWAELNRRGIR